MLDCSLLSGIGQVLPGVYCGVQHNPFTQGNRSVELLCSQGYKENFYYKVSVHSSFLILYNVCKDISGLFSRLREKSLRIFVGRPIVRVFVFLHTQPTSVGYSARYNLKMSTISVNKPGACIHMFGHARRPTGKRRIDRRYGWRFLTGSRRSRYH